MKRFLALSILFSISAGILFAETSITVKNTLDETVYYLYLSPANEREWGDDRLGEGLFDPGTSMEIAIDMAPANTIYDLMAEDELERTFRIEGIDLSKTDTIIISEDDFIPFGGKDPILTDILVKNDTDEDIYYVYISSRDSMYWGEDLLGDDILSAGDSILLEVPIDQAYPENDVLCESESGASYEIMDVNMIETQELLINEDNLTSMGSDDTYDDYDDYSDFDYSDDSAEEAYKEGYRAGFQDAWKEAYSQGFQDAMNQ